MRLCDFLVRLGPLCLQELSAVKHIGADIIYLPVFHEISYACIHVIACRQLECIGCLVGIYNVRLMLQPRIRSAGVIEGQVDVMGQVSKDIAEIFPQGIGDIHIRIKVELGLNLGRDVCHQSKFVIRTEVRRALA